MAAFRAGLTLFLLAQATSPLGAAEVSFFCTDALAPSMRELVPEFEKASGHHVKTTVESSKATLRSKGIDPDRCRRAGAGGDARARSSNCDRGPLFPMANSVLR
jgi:hypothetical protein